MEMKVTENHNMGGHLSTSEGLEPRLEDGKAKIMWPEEIVDAVLSEKPNKSRILIVSGKC